jgi:M6 family metalloprotease-like protein
VTGDVLGPFVLDADYFDQPLAARDAALRAAAGSADLTQYSRIFVVMPQGETGMDSGGMALLGCGQIPSLQGVLNASSMWLGAESMVTQGDVVATASHELGHGFGLEHARFADYGTDTVGPAGQPAAPWDSIHEYGDSFSNMGRQSAQWSAPQKTLLGWLQPDTNVQTIATNGTFTLPPYEQAGGVQALKVNRGTGPDDWLWIEYRQPQGTFDATLPTAAFAGALVHYADPALTATLSGVDPSTYTNLLNFHPAIPYAGDPTLHAGQTWNDPYGSLILTVNSADSTGLNVSVAYAAAPVCAQSAGAAQSFASTGGSGTIAVTAAGSCSWQAAASVPWISLGSGNAGMGNGSVSVTVAANPNISPRWGRITVGDAFAIITQPGSSGWMALSPQAASAPAMGGMAEFAVAASAPDLAWTMGTNVPWITDIECSCFTLVGSATVRYIVAANTGPARTGVINAGGIAFTVTQQAAARPAENVVWDQLTPPDAPVSRMSMAMAQFGRSGAILYGGNWNMALFADTWLWNGNAWSQLQPANNPGMRTRHAMVYDEARGQIVLFGGMAGATPVADNQTWVWDGTNWRQMQPAVSPPARFGHAMAYDSALQEVVMFGGYGEYGEMNDTQSKPPCNKQPLI